MSDLKKCKHINEYRQMGQKMGRLTYTKNLFQQYVKKV